MSKDIRLNTEEEKLIVRINQLRDTLNKMYCDHCEHESQELNEKKIDLSRYLDQLICEYMLLKNTNKKREIDADLIDPKE